MFQRASAAGKRSIFGSGPPSARRRWGGALLTLCCVLGIASAASAAPSQTIVYSTDGGVTWSTNVTLTPGQNFYVRQYNNNDTTDTINGVSVTTTLPAGFVRTANSTYVCINPSQGSVVLPAIDQSEIACNDLANAAGQGGPISDAAVWSGQNLTISPTANVYGTTPLNATNGPFAMGKKRYLNLHQCSYEFAPGVDAYVQLVRDTPNSDIFQTNTNASNTSDGTVTCGAGDLPGGFEFQPVNSAVQAVDLLAKRYANLHDCDYYSAAADDSFDQFVNNSPNPTGTFTAGTNSSNTADIVAVCGAGSALYPLQPQNSGVAPLDTLQNRYLNIHQCTFVKDDGQLTMDHFTLIAPPAGPTSPGYTTGTNASDTADGSVVCGAGNATYVPNTANMAVQAIDTLDQARGWQFVQYNVTAPTGLAARGTYTQTGALTGGATASDTGTITINGPASPACLTAAQVRGCWHFDELTGTTAIDSSGNGNNGTYLNGVTLGVGGVFMTAIQLDGVNDVVRVPDSNSLDVGDDFSLEGWVKRAAPASKTLEVFNKGANGFQVSVGNAASGSKVFLRKANVTTIATSTAGVPVDGSYHHIVVTKSGSSVVFYIDGVVAGTTGVSLVQVIQNTAQPLQFGEGNTAPVTFDEFAVYDRVLTAAEVAARYAAGNV